MQSNRHLYPIINRAISNAERLVQSSLLSIYEDSYVGDYKVKQIGTAFIVSWTRRPLVVTARHCLFGHNDDESPEVKSIFLGGRLQRIAAVRSGVIMSVPEFDIAAFFVDGIPQSRCLPQSALDHSGGIPHVASLFGFLSKDFNRTASTGELKPTPYFITLTNPKDRRPGYIEYPYNIRKGIDAQSGLRIMKPVPKGLSGSPMLDTADLWRGRVKVAGVLTEYRTSGLVVGEDVKKVCELVRDQSFGQPAT
ncbi:hypothetical protein AB4Z43_08450 [Mesorhizobium sp. 2RAF45]|uniref:hypothetical protein n=1 Tax=Mesorhizobium sp. 2RAF45 TaxID=3233001 RepID=UPI003F9DD263